MLGVPPLQRSLSHVGISPCWETGGDHARRGTPGTAPTDLQTRLTPRSPCPCPAVSSQPFSARNPKHHPPGKPFPHRTPCPGDALPAQSESRSRGRAAAARCLPEAVQGREHHVRGVQGVDEVGWEGVLLLHCIRLPAAQNGRWEELRPFQLQK